MDVNRKKGCIMYTKISKNHPYLFIYVFAIYDTINIQAVHMCLQGYCPLELVIIKFILPAKIHYQ